MSLNSYMNPNQGMPQMSYGPQGPYNYANLGDNWASPKQSLMGSMDYSPNDALGTPGGGGLRGLFDGFLGSAKDGIKTDGWGSSAIGAANSIFGAYMGMKQYGLAKEQFKFNKDMTTRNFNAQAGLTNSSLADRQGSRRAAGESVQDVASYMGQYGVKKV